MQSTRSATMGARRMSSSPDSLEDPVTAGPLARWKPAMLFGARCPPSPRLRRMQWMNFAERERGMLVPRDAGLKGGLART